MFGVWTPASMVSTWFARSSDGAGELPDPDRIARRFLSHLSDSCGWIDADRLRRELTWAVERLIGAASDADEFDAMMTGLRRGDGAAAQQWVRTALRGGVLCSEDGVRLQGALALGEHAGSALSAYETLLQLDHDPAPEAVEITRILSLRLGRDHLAANRLTDAERLLDRALRLSANQPAADADQASALAALGLLYHRRNDPEAETLYLRALALGEELGRADAVAALQLNLGLLYRRAERDRDATGMLNAAREWFARRDDKERRALIEGSLGELALAAGDFDRARECFSIAVGLERALGDVVCEAVCTANLGLAERRLGNYRAAETALRAAARLHAGLGNVEAEERCLGGLAAVAAAQGDLRTADRWFTRILEQCMGRGEWDRSLRITEQLVLIAERRGLPLQGEAYLTKMLKATEAAGRLDVTVCLLELAADTAEQRGRGEAAAAALERALELSETQGDRDRMSLLADRLGHLLRMLGRLDRAGECFRMAMMIDKGREDDMAIAADLANLGAVAAEIGQRTLAESHWRQALDLVPDPQTDPAAVQMQDWLERSQKSG